LADVYKQTELEIPHLHKALNVSGYFMRAFVSIVLTFFVCSIYGQTQKIISIPTFTNYKNQVDTTLWFKWKSELIRQVNLKDLKTVKDTFHLRFWTDIQAIDIWTTDHNFYSATITNYAQRYDQKLFRKGVYKVDKVFSNQIALDTSKARQLFSLVDTLRIAFIPTDDKIKGWQQGLDGEEFIIEVSTPTQYDFKTYWSPRVFSDTLIQAKQIQTLVDRLYKDFKIGSYYDKLKLPQGNYKRNGIMGITIGSNETIETKSLITDWF